ncbi:MAG: VWA domain-containing protein, partial [Culicoidibacterales bacterium]
MNKYLITRLALITALIFGTQPFFEVIAAVTGPQLEPKVGAVTQENVYSQQALYDEKSPLGAFQQLHLVGFHQISTHEQVNGNVITDLLDYHAPIEAQLSYVRQIQAETDVVLTKNTPDAIAVLGKNIEVQNRDQGAGISVMTTNGQRVQVLQPDQSLNPETILQDGELEFQDLAELKTLAINFNQLVSQYARTKGIETITEGEQLTITFDAETQVQVENFTAETLANVKKIVIKGMPKTHEQTYFLNLDLQGQKAFNFPKVVIEYPNGEQVAIEETAELSNNLIWNLFDSKVENTLTNATVTINDELTSNLLAPLATFDLQASVKGFVIAEAIQVFAPTYAASFTGETINRAADEPETTPEATTPEVSDPTPEAEVPETETPETTPEVEGTIPETEAVQPLVETYDLNGLTVTKSIDKTNLTVGEEATVTLTVRGTQSSSSLPVMTNNEEIILVIDTSQSTGAKWDEYKTQMKTFIANLFAANPNTNNGGKVTIKAIAFNGPGTGQDQNRNTQDSRLIFDQTKTLAEINTLLDGIQPGKSVSNGSDKASTNISGLFYVNAGATPLKTIVDAGITRNETKRIIIASDWITNTTTTMAHVTDDTIFNGDAANDAKIKFGDFVQNQIFNNGKITDKSKVKIYPIQLYSTTNSTVNEFITGFATTGNAKIANLVQAQKKVSAAGGLMTALNEIVTSIAGTTSTTTPKLTLTDYLDVTKFEYVANSAAITGATGTAEHSANTSTQTIKYSNITKGTSDVVVTYKIKAKTVGTNIPLSPTTSMPNVADGTNTQNFNLIQATVAAAPTPEVTLDLTADVNKAEITQGEEVEITLGLSANDKVSGTITDFIDTAKFEFVPGTYTAVSGTTEVGSVTINASAKSIQWEIKQEAKNIEATYKIKAKSGAVPGETLTNPTETPGTVVVGATVANFPDTPVTIAAALPTGNLTLNKTATANSDDTYSIMLEAKGTPEQTAPKTADIVIVIDKSGSMQDKIAQVKTAANSFVNNFTAELASGQVRIAIASFDYSANSASTPGASSAVRTAFTSTKATITTAINGLTASG